MDNNIGYKDLYKASDFIILKALTVKDIKRNSSAYRDTDKTNKMKNLEPAIYYAEII